VPFFHCYTCAVNHCAMSTCIGWIAFAAVVAVVPATLVAGRGDFGWGTGIRNSLGLCPKLSLADDGNESSEWRL
jgi:hypothetical protein